MSTGLYSGASGLALGVGLYKGVSSLWGGASGLVDGFGSSFSPASLFTLGEQGAWYDPSDLTTMWQEHQGENPVTTPGQSVGLILDKRVGTRTQVFSDGNVTFTGPAANTTRISSGVYAYARDGAGVGQVVFGGLTTGRAYLVSVQIAAYSGAVPGIASTRADFFSATGASPRTFASVAGTYTFYYLADGTNFSIRSGAVGAGGTISNVSILEVAGNHATQATAAQRPTYGIVPATGRRNLLLATTTLSTQSVTVTNAAHTLSFTGTGTVTLSGASTAGPLVGTGAGDRVSLTFTPTAGSLTLTVSGSVTLAQLELGSLVTTYQRVGTAFDVTEAGVASMSYLSFDGTDDGMLTGNIVPGTNKVQVFAGVRKLSDAGFSPVILETSVSSGINDGSLLLTSNSGGGSPADYGSNSRGTASATLDTPNTFAAPITNIVTLLADIAAPSAALRVNGAVAASSTATQGTGNYLTHPLYIGRRGGASLPYNGQIYGIILRFGANLSAATVTQTETWLGQRAAPTVVIT